MNERTLNRPRNIKKRLQCSGIELGEEELCDMDDRMNMRCLIRSRNFGMVFPPIVPIYLYHFLLVSTPAVINPKYTRSTCTYYIKPNPVRQYTSIILSEPYLNPNLLFVPWVFRTYGIRLLSFPSLLKKDKQVSANPVLYTTPQ